MHTHILIRINALALAHDETFERPVAITNPKLSTTRIINLIDRPDHNVDQIIVLQTGSVLCFQATMAARAIAGIPVAAAYRKKLNHPTTSWMSPE